MFFFFYPRKGTSPNNDIDAQDVIRRLMPYGVPDASGFLRDTNNSLLVQCVHWNTSWSKLEPAPFCHAESETVAASWARLDNRDELGRKLDLHPATRAHCCDTELILQAYIKWQENCVDHLIGDFVFVIHDRKRQLIFCGRDHMGVRPFYYYVSDDVFICATSLAALLHLKSLPIQIKQQWIAEYLMELSMSFDGTPYTDIKKLPPAHCLAISPTQIRLWQYSDLSTVRELRLKDSREYVDAYREQLESAIRCRLESDYAIGTELSGGIDSSTITAYAARMLGPSLARLHAFGFAFLELEPQYISAISREYRLPHTHIVAGIEMDWDEITDRSLQLLGYPVEHGNATVHEVFYQSAEKLGVRTLLSGFGGDEFGTTIHGYLVPLELRLQRRFKDLVNILQGNIVFRLLRLIKLEFRRWKTQDFTFPAYNPHFYKALSTRWPYSIVCEELINRFNLKERYFNVARFDAGYTNLRRFTLEQRWQPFVPTRMDNCNLMAGGRKIEYRWPLLDVRLVRLFLSIPSEENYYRGLNRYLHRRAIRGIVPDMVAWKPGKDMGAVMAPRRKNFKHLLDFSLSDLHPAIRACINIDKFQEQMRLIHSWSVEDMSNDIGLQVSANLRAVKILCAWMNFLESVQKI